MSELEQENIKLKKIIKAKDDLLVCYRIKKRPSDKLLEFLNKNSEYIKKVTKNIGI